MGRALEFLEAIGSVYKFSISSNNADPLYALDTIRWFSGALASFVGSNYSPEGALIKHNKRTGTVSRNELRRHLKALSCKNDEDLDRLMGALESAEICFKLPADVNEEAKYQFHCLLPIQKSNTSKLDEWKGIIKQVREEDSKSKVQSKFVGRRLQVVNEKSGHLPPSYFPTVIHHITSKMFTCITSLMGNVVFLHRGGARLLLSLSIENESNHIPRFVDMISYGGNDSFSLLSDVFSICEDVLQLFPGLNVNHFALCTHCLSNLRPGHCETLDCLRLHYMKPQSNDQMSIESSDRIDPIKHWRLVSPTNLVCLHKDSKTKPLDHEVLLWGTSSNSDANESSKKVLYLEFKYIYIFLLLLIYLF